MSYFAKLTDKGRSDNIKNLEKQIADKLFAKEEIEKKKLEEGKKYTEENKEEFIKKMTVFCLQGRSCVKLAEIFDEPYPKLHLLNGLLDLPESKGCSLETSTSFDYEEDPTVYYINWGDECSFNTDEYYRKIENLENELFDLSY